MKTLMIKDDVYKKLKMLKRENESFSDVISRLISQADNRAKLEKFFGILSEEETEAMKKESSKVRKKLSKSLEDRIKKVTAKLSE
ncbi:MAG: antitoxin VapB family protein [Candidatus Odinarchaeota archaeon]|nr:antitoxin VapB family protein [Candidatus Odinarchaeota archaeon]